MFPAAGIASGDDLEARERIAGTWASSEPGGVKAAWALEEDGGNCASPYECSVKLGWKAV